MGKSKLDIIISAQDKASSVISGVEGKTTRLSGVFSGLGRAALGAAGILTGAMVGAGAAIGSLVNNAMQFEGVVVAFEDATQGMAGGGEAVMQAMRDASSGMVRDTELMKNYNLATQLLGQTFANDLPAAMGPIAKVAAATGEDIGFLTDSYVRGIGRLSPMILDNLGIQVDLNDAYAEWATANGIAVEAMSKEQQQAALTARVNEMLMANTADMPELVGTSAQAWGAFQTTLANLKDTIGLQLLPAFTPLFGQMAEWVEQYGPDLVDWITDEGIPALTDFVTWVGEEGPGAFQKLSDLATGTLDVITGIVDGIKYISETLGIYGDIIEAQPDIVGRGAYPGVYTDPANRPVANTPAQLQGMLSGQVRGETVNTFGRWGQFTGITPGPTGGVRAAPPGSGGPPPATESSLVDLGTRMKALETAISNGLNGVEASVKQLPGQIAGRIAMTQ